MILERVFVELFKLFGSIAIENSKANKALADTAKKAGTTSKEIRESVNRIGTAAAGIAKGIGIAGAAIGGAWIAAIEGSREYRAEMALLDSAFQVQGHSSEVAKNTYSDLNAVMRDSGAAVEAAQHLALVADNEDELSKMTHTLTGVYSTFGKSLPLEGLAEAINHSSALGSTQGSLADALEWSGITVEEFDEQLEKCSNEEERQDLIMKTLSDTYDKAADQYKETNKDVIAAEKANERLADAMAEIGAIGEPILTKIKEKVAEFAEAAVPKIQEFIDKIKDMKKWIEDNEETIDIWVAVIIGATVAIGSFLLILNWGTIMTAAANAVKTVRLAILALNAALKANPIGFVISLIAGLVAAFIYLWNNNEGFRKFFLDMWDKIKSASGKAVDWIKDKFNVLKDALKTVRETFGKIKDEITDRLNSARDSVKKAIDKIKGFFNIKLKFKGISMPDISIAWKKSPKWMYEAAKLIGLDGVPSFSVKWNAEGGVMTKPTIFGMTGNTFLGGGESGAEAIAPISVLQDYIRSAVNQENAILGKILIEQNRIMMDFLERVIPNDLRLDSGALVGALIPGIDMQLSSRWSHSKRMNTR